MQKSTEARRQMAIATPFSLPAAPLHRFWSHKHEVRWPALPQVWRWNWCFNMDMSQPTLNCELYTDTVSAARGGGRVIQAVSGGVVALLDQDIIWSRLMIRPHHKPCVETYLSIYHLYRSLPPWGRTGPGRWSRSRSPLSLGSSLGLRVRRCSIGDRLQQQLDS